MLMFVHVMMQLDELLSTKWNLFSKNDQGAPARRVRQSDGDEDSYSSANGLGDNGGSKRRQRNKWWERQQCRQHHAEKGRV